MHGFDRGGAAGGDEAGYDRGDKQQECDGREDGEVELSDSVEGALHAAADEVGSDEADGEADAGENQAFPDDEGNDTAAVCAEGHAEGDLVRALRHREGHDAVDTECGEKKRNGGEADEEDESEAVVGENQLADLLHGAGLGEGYLGVDGVDGCGDALDHGGGVVDGADADACTGPGSLPEGDLHLGAVFAEAAAADVVVDADDLPLDGRAEFGDAGDELLDGDALLERVDAFEVLLHEVFVDDGYFDAGGGVLIGEGAAIDYANAEGFEEVGGDHAEAGVGSHGGVVEGRFSDDGKRHAKARAEERKAGHRGG